MRAIEISVIDGMAYDSEDWEYFPVRLDVLIDQNDALRLLLQLTKYVAADLSHDEDMTLKFRGIARMCGKLPSHITYKKDGTPASGIVVADCDRWPGTPPKGWRDESAKT